MFIVKHFYPTIIFLYVFSYLAVRDVRSMGPSRGSYKKLCWGQPCYESYDAHFRGVPGDISRYIFDGIIYNSDALSRSRYIRHSFACRKTDAGHCGLTGPRTALRTAALFRSPGTVQKIAAADIIVGIVRVTASFGTSSSVAKQPSFTCCRLLVSSRSTTFTGCGSRKSAT